jgi:hypothetical protein
MAMTVGRSVEAARMTLRVARTASGTTVRTNTRPIRCATERRLSRSTTVATAERRPLWLLDRATEVHLPAPGELASIGEPMARP